MNTNSFKIYLQNELVKRCRLNPNYSLRSFARNLEVEPSALSQILRGKRTLTAKMTLKLSQKLDISPKDAQKFNELKNDKNNKKEEFKELTSDLFEVLSEWYYFAILELMNTKTFNNNPKWIARSLGLTMSEVNISIDRLQRLGMLKIDSKGKWHDLTGGKTNLGDPKLTNQALKRYQKRILNLSQKALDDISIEKRDHSGTMMAIDTNKIPKAKELIKKFRRQMGKLLTGENEDEVYQLQISLFPLSQNITEKQ